GCQRHNPVDLHAAIGQDFLSLTETDHLRLYGRGDAHHRADQRQLLHLPSSTLHGSSHFLRRRRIASGALKTSSDQTAGSGTAAAWPFSKAWAKAAPNSALSCAGESVGVVLPNV